MDPRQLTALLESVAEGQTTPQQALARLRHMPYEDLSFARLDHHRALRHGFPEVIYCEGKTDSQVLAIVSRMLKAKQTILATRANEALARKVRRLARRAKYHPLSRCIVVSSGRRTKPIGGVLVLSAGTSDIPVAEEAAVTAETLGSKVRTLYDVGVAGLHRLLSHRNLLVEARVLVVVAGMDGALPSVVGGLTDKPIVAVPTSVGYGASFRGIAPLLTMLNSCAPGVAVVNIDNGFGAGVLAHRINAGGGRHP
ncbi:MAG: 1-(5-phosphoribosyl)-5-amino-4-imidazole-carboxylate carboxylase [Nitrospirae bacterium RBG_16_64_22]|nr:MAG: 1-(5-phosphoribosyl)-5-amino-4-imidazole-carboxylate carboxylase [Nitrospirae bacterium RBG_16_64_22]